MEINNEISYVNEYNNWLDEVDQLVLFINMVQELNFGLLKILLVNGQNGVCLKYEMG